MHRILLVVALLAASALPARAEMMLYATAASQQRIDGFPLRDDGTLEGEPRIQRQTASLRPKRLIANGCTLYSLEEDRVEVFRIGAKGELTLVGATKRSDDMKGDDIALSEDKRTLYVPFRIANVLAAYPLGDDGAPSFDPVAENGVPAGKPTSCAFAAGGVAWEDIGVGNGKLYATTSSRINVYGLDATGQILGTARVPGDLDGDGTISSEEQEEDNLICPFYSTSTVPPNPCPCDLGETPACTTGADRPNDTCPLSRRGDLQGPTGLVVADTYLVTGLNFGNRLLGFALATDGNFLPCPPPPDNTDPANKSQKKQRSKCEKKERKANLTTPDFRYIGLTLNTMPDNGPIVYATAPKGRVDDFRIHAPKPNGRFLPKKRTSATTRNVVSTPVRTTIRQPTGDGNPMLYVAGGEEDRVSAFRLHSGGAIPDGAKHTSRTNVQSGSYPNDVLVVDLAGCN